jgi:hypothetical protein
MLRKQMIVDNIIKNAYKEGFIEKGVYLSGEKHTEFILISGMSNLAANSLNNKDFLFPTIKNLISD